jgi:hypothetical protein
MPTISQEQLKAGMILSAIVSLVIKEAATLELNSQKG